MFGADCDHVGDIYECPQGTYAIGRRAPLQNNFIYTKTQTTKIFVIQNKLFVILYYCNFMMYCMWFHTGFCLGGGGGAPSVLRQVRHLLLHHWKTLLLLPHLRPLQNRSVTAYTSGPSSTCGKKN